MDEDGAPQLQQEIVGDSTGAVFDAAVDVEAKPSKRPRLGRRPGDILSGIDADTSCAGWERSLRYQLLHIGDERADDPALVVCRQGEEFLAAFRRFGSAALDIFFEA